MTEGESGQSNCILGLNKHMVWITYILGCAQTIYINAGPKENSYFHEKVAIDKKWVWGHRRKLNSL